MLGGLSCIRFSDRYNAVYDPEIFHKMMIKAVMAGSNLASVVNAVRESRIATSAKNLCMPTAEWFRQRTKDAEIDLVAGVHQHGHIRAGRLHQGSRQVSKKTRRGNRQAPDTPVRQKMEEQAGAQQAQGWHERI